MDKNEKGTNSSYPTLEKKKPDYFVDENFKDRKNYSTQTVLKNNWKAMDSVNSENWQVAMQQEIKSLTENDTYKVVSVFSFKRSHLLTRSDQILNSTKQKMATIYFCIVIKSSLFESARIKAFPSGLSTLVKELSAAARIMQSFSKELSTLVADRVQKCKQTDAAAVAT